MRKMALNRYVLYVDLYPVWELFSLKRRYDNNLNQVAVHANAYGVYQKEIIKFQKYYAVLEELSAIVEK